VEIVLRFFTMKIDDSAHKTGTSVFWNDRRIQVAFIGGVFVILAAVLPILFGKIDPRTNTGDITAPAIVESPDSTLVVGNNNIVNGVATYRFLSASTNETPDEYGYYSTLEFQAGEGILPKEICFGVRTEARITKVDMLGVSENWSSQMFYGKNDSIGYFCQESPASKRTLTIYTSTKPLGLDPIATTTRIVPGI